MPKRKKSRKRKKVFPKVAEAAFGPKLAEVGPNWARLGFALAKIWGLLGGGFDTKSHCSVSSSNVLQCILLFNFGVNLGPRDWEIFLRVCENFYSGPIAIAHITSTCMHLGITCTWA